MADLRIRAEVLDEQNNPTILDVNVNLCTVTPEGITDGHKDFWPWRNPEKAWEKFCTKVKSLEIY